MGDQTPDRAERGVIRGLSATAVWRTDRRMVLALSVLMLAVQLVGSFLLPLLEVPDERFHVDLAAVARGHAADGWPGGRTRLLDGGVANLRSRYDAERTVQSATPRQARLPLLADEPASSNQFNPMTKHPPLYYITIDIIEDVVDVLWPGSFTADEEVMLYRWLSAMFLIPLPFLCMAAAHILGADWDTIRLAGIIPVLIPGLVLRDGALVNNDALVVLMSSLTIVASLEIARGSGRWVVVIGAVAAGLASLAKLFGLAVLPALALGIAMSYRYRSQGDFVVSAGLASVAFTVTGGWFWIRNWLITGSFFEQISPRPPVDGFEPDWGYWTIEVIKVTWSQFWGGGFVLSSRTFGPWLVTATAVLVVAAAVALVRWGLHGPQAGLVWLAVLPLAAMAVIVYGHQFRRYPMIGAVIGVQGRYFYVALVGFVALAALGIQSLAGRRLRIAPLATLGAALMTWWSVWVMLGRYWGPPSAAIGQRLSALIAWSPIWPPAAYLAVVGAALAFGWTFVESVRNVRPTRPARAQVPNTITQQSHR